MMKYFILALSILFLNGCLFYSPPKREYFKFDRDSSNSKSNLKFGFYIHVVGPAEDDEGFIGRDDLPDINNYTLYEPIVLLPKNEFYWFWEHASYNEEDLCQVMFRVFIKNLDRRQTNRPYGLYKITTKDSIMFEKVMPIRESGKTLHFITYGSFKNDTLTIFKEIQLKRDKIIRVKKMNKKFVYYPFVFEFKSPFE